MENNYKECKVCRKSSDTKFLEEYKINGISYSLFECPKCGVCFWEPFLNPGGEWYEKDERYNGANKNPAIEPTHSHKKTIASLKPYIGKVLDIGCGTGNFLYYAKLNGWDVYGIDFDQNAVDTAKSVFNIPNVENSSLGDYIKKQNEKFDLVTFFDVFEHIDNHLEFLNQIGTTLKLRGYIAMSMPYRYGSRFLMPHDLPPRHLTRWSRSSLKKFLEDNGYEVVLVKKLSATVRDIVIKLRFKFNFFNFGLVSKIANKDKPILESGGKKIINRSFKIRAAKFLAYAKDMVIFGIPAAIVWVILFIKGEIYTGLFAIARKCD